MSIVFNNEGDIQYPDTAHISDEDLGEYAAALEDAFKVYVERERIRRGLWKQYSTLDQARTIRFKIDRVISALERGEPEPPMVAEINSEFDDIINYSVFGKRLMRGNVT